MLAPGIVLNGRYQLTQRIAAGGMGEVWRGADRLLNREVAVKVVLPGLMADREFITRFRSEARMMAQLRHPGIVQVYDYGENAVVGNDRFDYMVMEYIDGISLSKKVQDAGRLSPAETMAITAGVADALHAAHQSGIIHRDVKPANLLVRPGGAIVLVDFGVARSVGVTGITSTNVVMGSVHYMAPEQAEGKPVTAATDVYALGAVAFHCLTGRPPYVGDNPLAILGQLVHGQPPVLPPDVPRGVAAVVMRALAKDPAQRFPSGAALADAARNAGRAPNGGAFGPGGPTGQQTRPFPGPPPSSGAYPASRPSGAYQPMRPSGAYPAARPSGAYAAGAASVPPAYPGGGTGSYPGDVPSDGYQAAAEPPAKRRNVAVLAALALVLAGGGVLAAFWPDSSNADTTGSPTTTQAADTPQQPAGDDDEAEPTPSKSRKRTPKPSPSSASPEPSESSAPAVPAADPRDVCDGDFQVLDQAPLKNASGVLRGTVYLLVRAADNTTCVVTVKDPADGKKAVASAFLELQGSPRKTAGGTIKDFAGPVIEVAQDVCVKWGGSIGAATFESEFDRC
ncbi:serine/threonine-protein kinase [Actinoplanes palleronii]|uniref:non-specific serine/threonine protein kinase n=1 Tax=Actinoplanes palleronii TaxID=113570 RepID=A0ABQ4B0Q3_9ACTN|nr:serine/threonine-protein kinase [Actinoplanes palleronii]GIE64247.1 hypothetical protein Apa02nite_003550 [Actinoplanes palleronii]